MFELMVEDTFSAAHQLLGYQGPCENLHGHSFKVQIFIEGNRLKKEGYLIDFREIKTVLKEILAEFDHHNLNEVSYFKEQNPTAENIAKVIYEKMGNKFPIIKTTVWESATTSASYTLIPYPPLPREK